MLQYWFRRRRLQRRWHPGCCHPGEGGLGNVFLGQLDGSFLSSGTTLPYAFTNQSVVADFDGNGSQDVAVLGTTTGTVYILLNKNSFQPTSTLLSESPAHVVAGQPLNFSVAVGSQQGTPTGSVVFKKAGIVPTSQALNAGAAQTTLSAPTALGQYGYTALYTGDGTYSGSCRSGSSSPSARLQQPRSSPQVILLPNLDRASPSRQPSLRNTAASLPEP